MLERLRSNIDVRALSLCTYGIIYTEVALTKSRYLLSHPFALS